MLETVYQVQSIKQVITEERKQFNKIGSPEDVLAVTEDIKDEDREIFLVIVLNTSNNVVAVHRNTVGTLGASLAHPREVFKTAILNNASSIILAHNHPGNSTEPSQDDIEVTDRMRGAGTILGIPLLDHMIVTPTNGYTSLKEQGYL